MKADGVWDGPALKVGQVWDLGETQIVITGVKGKMAEYRASSGSKAMRSSRGKLATITELRERLAAANATLASDSPPNQ